MSKPDLKKTLAESFKETLGETALPSASEDNLPDSVQQLKMDIDARIEAEAIGVEFLEQLKGVVVSRRKLKEAQDDVAGSLATIQELVSTMMMKIDVLGDLKKENLALERKVLKDIEERVRK